MFQNFLLKKMLKAKGVPDEQVDMFVRMMEKNPELFKAIAQETEAKVKSGMSHEQAGLEVMKKYEAELRKLI